MSQANFGTAYIGVKVDNTAVDRGLRETEQKVETASRRIEGKVGGGIGGAFKIGAGALLAIKSFELATRALTGDWQKVAEIIYTLPLGIGQASRALSDLIDEFLRGPDPRFGGKDHTLLDSIISNIRIELGVDREPKAGRKKATVDFEKELEERQRRLAGFAAEGSRRLEGLEKQLEIERAITDEDRKRIQIDQQFRATTKGLDNFPPDQSAKILAGAEELRRLQLEAIKPAGAGLGQQISARTALSQFPNQADAPKAKQVDITNQYLQNLVRIVANLDNQARAQ